MSERIPRSYRAVFPARLLRYCVWGTVIAVLNVVPVELGRLIERKLPAYHLRQLAGEAAEAQAAIVDGRAAEVEGGAQEALAKYQTAATKAKDAEIAKAALEHIEGVTIRQRNAWSVAYRARQLSLAGARYVVGVSGFILALWLLSYLPRRPGIAIGEFAKSSSAGDDESQEVRRGLSNAISEIHIAHSEAAGQPSLLSERFNPPGIETQAFASDDLSRFLSGLADVQVVRSLNLPVKALADIASHFLNRRQFLISGSVSVNGERVSAIARLTNLRTHSLVRQWEASKQDFDGLRIDSPSARNEQAFQLGRLLAYQILFELLRMNTQIRAKNWRSFYHVTESRRLDSGHAEQAIQCLRNALDFIDPSYDLARFNLGRLYLARGDWDAARREFEALTDRIASEADHSIRTAFERIEAGATSTARLVNWIHRRKVDRINLFRKGAPIYRVRDRIAKLPEQLESRDEDASGKPRVYRALRSIQNENLERLINSYKDIADHVEQLKSVDPVVPKTAIEVLQEIFDPDAVETVHFKVEMFWSFLGVKKLLAEHSGEEDFLKAEIRELKELSNQAKIHEVKAAVEVLAVLLGKRDWRAAEHHIDFMLKWLQPVDEHEARALERELVVGAASRMGWVIPWIDTAFPEFREIREWERSQKTSFYADCGYNLAVAHYCSFRPAGFLKAVVLARRLQAQLRAGSSGSDRKRRQELKSLAMLLEMQASSQFLNPPETDADWAGERVKAAVDLRWELRTDPERIEKQLREGIEGHSREIHAAMHNRSAGVRAAAYKTWGLCNESTAAASYFEKALEIQPSINAYVYLAAAKIDTAPKESRRLLEFAIRESPQHELAKRLLAMLDRRASKQEETSPGDAPATDATEEIARVAYELWLSRGRPTGSAEQDWHRAELIVRANIRGRDPSPEPAANAG